MIVWPDVEAVDVGAGLMTQLLSINRSEGCSPQMGATRNDQDCFTSFGFPCWELVEGVVHGERVFLVTVLHLFFEVGLGGALSR